MRTLCLSPVLVLFSASCGAVYAYAGYNPEAEPGEVVTAMRGLVWLSGRMAAFTVVAILLTPVLLRINEGRWDWRKARTEAVRLAVGSMQLVALFLAGYCSLRLAVATSEGWLGGWRAAAVGALIGAAVCLLLGLGFARLRIAERLGVPDQKAEPGAAADGGA